MSSQFANHLDRRTSAEQVHAAVLAMMRGGPFPTIAPQAGPIIEEFHLVLLQECFLFYNNQHLLPKLHVLTPYRVTRSQTTLLATEKNRDISIARVKHANVDIILHLGDCYRIGCQLKATLQPRLPTKFLHAGQYQKQLGIAHALPFHEILVAPCHSILLTKTIGMTKVSVTNAQRQFCPMTLVRTILQTIDYYASHLTLLWTDELTLRSRCHQREHEIGKLLLETPIGPFLREAPGGEGRCDHLLQLPFYKSSVTTSSSSQWSLSPLWRVERRCVYLMPNGYFRVNLTCGRGSKKVYQVSDFDILLAVYHKPMTTTTTRRQICNLWLLPSVALAIRYGDTCELPQSITVYPERGWTHHFHLGLEPFDGGSAATNNSSTGFHQHGEQWQRLLTYLMMPLSALDIEPSIRRRRAKMSKNN